MHPRIRILATVAGLCLAPASWAACPTDEQVAAFVAEYRALSVSQGLGSALTLQEGRCAQAKVLRRLTADLGPVVGYKAGLTNPAMQQRFGVDHPLRGVLLRDMLLKSGAQVPAAFGARPFFEADFVVVVKDDGLARATSLRQAAESISHVVPFMELPDLMLDPKVTLTGPALVAMNVGARLGVLGEPIPMQTTDEFIDALASMTVTLNQDGVELHRGPGTAIMGHPLNSAIWLARDLERAGIRLQAGDLLSLGSFLPIAPPKPGSTASVKYLGLPGDPEVSVSFR
jgi:2-keto-4-pentenoate hydratase